MSLLDRKAPHELWVQLRETVRTPEGLRTQLEIGDPIRVRCKVEPVRDWSSAEETYFAGLQVKDLRVIYSRTWPGDLNSIILYRGELYETVGQPQLYNSSRRTSHYRITVKWIGDRGADRWPSTIPEED